MSEPFLGEIRVFSFGFAPRGWAFCNGQILPINQNQALFSLLGTFYGGKGINTFALPDMQGRVPLHVGNLHALGDSGGEENHVLTLAEMPAHFHPIGASSNNADRPSPSGAFSAVTAANAYHTSSNTTMSSQASGSAGSGQGHPNMSPYLVLNFCIALSGIFPSRN
jgi:microcystin-dependent protein